MLVAGGMPWLMHRSGDDAWSPVIHSAGALVLLVLAVVLSVYKPKGLTRYGQRTQHKLGQATAEPR